MTPLPPPGASFQDETQAQLTALLYRNAGTGPAVNVIVASGIAYLGTLGRPFAPIALWWLAMLLLFAGRMMQARHYHATAPLTADAPRWRTRFLAGSTATSVMWLVGASYIMVAASSEVRYMTGMIVAGLAAGAVPILAPVVRAFRLYAIPLLGGIALMLFVLAREPLDWLFGIVTLVFLAATLRSASLLGETLESSIRLGLEKSDLALHLEEARQAADAAAVAKGRFLATMSHEIRTPMNGILGMAQLLLEPGLPEAEREGYARTVLSCGNALLRLLNDILDFSRIEAGGLSLESIVFQPAEIGREVVVLMAETAAAKTLELEFRGQSLAGRDYLGDPHRIRQMLTNLVSNAIKFTPQGRIVVEARELGGAGQEGLLEFTVTDSGIGIAQDKCALLFRPFSQADSSTTREYGGTGLGLSIVRSLAEQMGGSVGFESCPGVGSRFWFRIRATPAAAADLNHDAHLRAPAPPAASMCGHVLVVEDNPINRKVLSALLTRMGLRVSLAENGAEGFDAVCRDASIDLVLIDVNMPVLDGIAATGKIRAWEQGQARVPIVALTADAFEADRQRCMDAGMNDFLAKPVVIKALREVLERWLPAAGAGAVRTGGPRAPDS